MDVPGSPTEWGDLGQTSQEQKKIHAMAPKRLQQIWLSRGSSLNPESDSLDLSFHKGGGQMKSDTSDELLALCDKLSAIPEAGEFGDIETIARLKSKLLEKQSEING